MSFDNIYNTRIHLYQQILTRIIIHTNYTLNSNQKLMHTHRIKLVKIFVLMLDYEKFCTCSGGTTCPPKLSHRLVCPPMIKESNQD